MSDEFGPIVSRWQVEQAVIAALNTPPAGSQFSLLAYYLAEVERQTGLPAQTIPLPPGPDSVRGGIDADTFLPEWMPVIHTLCQPSGSTEKLDPYTFAQPYQIQVVCTVGDDDEDQARMFADSYCAAIGALLAQNGTLSGLAIGTQIDTFGQTELLDDHNARQVARSTLTMSALIGPVVSRGGPNMWPSSPYMTPPTWPTVSTVDVTVNTND